MVPVADGLDFPTSVVINPRGSIFVAESGLPFDGALVGGVVSEVFPDGSRAPLAEGLRPPVNGLAWHEGSLIVSEGGTPGASAALTPKPASVRLFSTDCQDSEIITPIWRCPVSTAGFISARVQ